MIQTGRSGPPGSGKVRQDFAERVARALKTSGVPAEAQYLAGGLWGAVFRVEGLPQGVQLLAAPDGDYLARGLYVVAEDESGSSYPAAEVGRVGWANMTAAILRTVPAALRLRALDLC